MSDPLPLVNAAGAWIDPGVRLTTKIIHGQCAGVAEQSWMIFNNSVKNYNVTYTKNSTTISVAVNKNGPGAWVGCASDGYSYQLVSTDPL